MQALRERRSDHVDPAALADAAIDLLPDAVVGIGEWHPLAVRRLAEHMAAAVASGQSYRVANAVRALAYVPSRDELLAVVDAVSRALSGDSFGRGPRWERLNGRIDEVRRTAVHVLDEIAAVRTAASTQTEVVATIAALLDLVRLHDAALHAHLEAVAALGRRLATWIGCDAETVRRTAHASALHDIALRSFAAVPSDEVREHVLAGAELVSRHAALADLAPIVASHHERYDGAGFPGGLAAEAIPLEARIIAVADEFHAVAVGSVDRAAGAADALQRVRAGGGNAFDPAIVDALAQLCGRDRRHKIRSA